MHAGCFLEMQFWGEIAFVGRENVKNIQTKFVIVWGGNSKLREGNFPPKGPEKTLHACNTLLKFNTSVWMHN